MELLDFRTGEMIEVGEVVRQDDDGNYYIAKKVCELIEAAEKWKKDVDAAYKEYRASLKGAMEKSGIDKIDATAFVASYKGGYMRQGGIDTEKLQNEYPEVYEKCRKEGSWVNPTVSVRLRK